MLFRYNGGGEQKHHEDNEAPLKENEAVTKQTPTQSLSAFLAPRYWLTWLGLGIMCFIAYLPLPIQTRIGKFVGLVGYTLGRSRRYICEVNIQLCFPELSRAQQKQLVRRIFVSNGIGFVETAMAWFRPPKHFRDLVMAEGLEHIETAMQQGKGVLLLGAHFSTLDLAGKLLSLFVDFDVTYSRHKNPLFEAFMKKARESSCQQAIERKDVRTMMKRLKSGRIVWYAPDQDYGPKHSVFAKFFGVNAATVTATSRFAKFNHSPVLLCSHFRNDSNEGYTMHFSPIIENYPSGKDLQDASKINRVIEQAIRKHPDQYLWLHKRFKTQAQGQVANPYPQLKVPDKKLSHQQYLHYRAKAQVLTRDNYGDKVLALESGNIFKLFRIKQAWSSATLYPYSYRFIRNARKISKLGIATITPLKHYKIPSIERTAVRYLPLEGPTLRELGGSTGELGEGVISATANFIALLHGKGIFFRSVHLGNIVQLSNGDLGLIDVSDMFFQSRPLSKAKRLRNFNHILRYLKDLKLLQCDKNTLFFDHYFSASKIKNKKSFQQGFNHLKCSHLENQN